MSATGLDHVGVVGHDLGTLAAAFERIGFQLTPPAAHAGGRTGNRCAMLRAGYLELMAVLPGGSSTTLQRFLARHAGAHIAALSVDDPAAETSRLQRAGIAPVSVSEAERAVDAQAEPARFGVVLPPDQPEGRFLLIRHHTPARLWQDRFLHHPNHAVALAELLLRVADTADTAARLSRLSGCPILPDPLGGYILELAQGRIRMLPAEAIAPLLPDVVLPEPPCMAGVTLHTGDGNAALRCLLDERAVTYRQVGAATVTVAGGVALRFVPSEPASVSSSDRGKAP